MFHLIRRNILLATYIIKRYIWKSTTLWLKRNSMSGNKHDWMTIVGSVAVGVAFLAFIYVFAQKPAPEELPIIRSCREIRSSGCVSRHGSWKSCGGFIRRLYSGTLLTLSAFTEALYDWNNLSVPNQNQLNKCLSN